MNQNGDNIYVLMIIKPNEAISILVPSICLLNHPSVTPRTSGTHWSTLTSPSPILHQGTPKKRSCYERGRDWFLTGSLLMTSTLSQGGYCSLQVQLCIQWISMQSLLESRWWGVVIVLLLWSSSCPLCVCHDYCISFIDFSLILLNSLILCDILHHIAP